MIKIMMIVYSIWWLLFCFVERLAPYIYPTTYIPQPLPSAGEYINHPLGGGENSGEQITAYLYISSLKRMSFVATRSPNSFGK